MGLKKSLGAAALAAGIGAAAIGGGTFALFTDTAANTGNTFTAGTLTLDDVSGGAIVSQAVNFDNLAPGDSGTVSMTVENNGTLDAWVKIDDTATNASKTGDLFGGDTPLSLTLDTDVVRVPAGGQTTFDVDYAFPLGADNSYQGDTGSFEVVVQAVQARNNTNGTDTAPNAWQ
ncbi:CalY family protein [Rossellomorea aquimaris]|uniref:TasA family protein n=1 Tax=Rossellomorea aquimaris TaxID=189382 RepID=UPI001CD1D222|nr:TasA family protein [Rossellomorea aquimaris]MCA1055231.1 CalY family protein [Rossellomorea aquimaris]